MGQARRVGRGSWDRGAAPRIGLRGSGIAWLARLGMLNNNTQNVTINYFVSQANATFGRYTGTTSTISIAYDCVGASHKILTAVRTADILKAN